MNGNNGRSRLYFCPNSRLSRSMISLIGTSNTLRRSYSLRIRMAMSAAWTPCPAASARLFGNVKDVTADGDQRFKPNDDVVLKVGGLKMHQVILDSLR